MSSAMMPEDGETGDKVAGMLEKLTAAEVESLAALEGGPRWAVELGLATMGGGLREWAEVGGLVEESGEVGRITDLGLKVIAEAGRRYPMALTGVGMDELKRERVAAMTKLGEPRVGIRQT